MKQFILFFLFLSSFTVFTQNSDSNITDAEKEILYTKFSKEVKNYSLKQFEELFFEFQQKSFSNEILTKDEFYDYTIKIAAFSERYAGLYPKEKEAAEQNKKMWLSKTYSDYLQSKKQNNK